MEAVVLIQKLGTLDTANILTICYGDISRAFIDNEDAFNAYITDIKKLLELEYDFETLTKLANQLTECFELPATEKITRKDVKAVCDSLCEILGDKITDLGRAKWFVAKPSCLEDYCPFADEALVVYGQAPSMVKYEGKYYKTVEKKLEETPYYRIYCTSLDL